MRCLYCGAEQALLKKLRGTGEFCSDEHRQAYNEEYSRAALGMLIQAGSESEPVPERRSFKKAASERDPSPVGFMGNEPHPQQGPHHQGYGQEPLRRPDKCALPQAVLETVSEIPKPNVERTPGSPAQAAPEPSPASLRESLYDKLQQKGLIGRLHQPASAAASVAEPPSAPPAQKRERRLMPVADRLADSTQWIPLDLRGDPITTISAVECLTSLYWHDSTRLYLTTTGLEGLSSFESPERAESVIPPVAKEAPIKLAEPPPPPVEQPLSVVEQAALDCKFPPAPPFAAATPESLRVHLPKTGLATLRSKFVWAPKPEPKPSHDEPVAEVAPPQGFAVKIKPVVQTATPATKVTPISPGHPANPGNPTIPGRPAQEKSFEEAVSTPPARERELQEGTRVKSRPNRAAARIKTETPAPAKVTPTEVEKPEVKIEKPAPVSEPRIEQPSPAPLIDAPQLGLTTSELSPVARLLSHVPGWAKAAVIVLALAGGVTYLATTSSQPSAKASAPALPAAPTPVAMGAGGWTTEWASDDTGLAPSRRLSLYKPSMTMTDYRMDFAGRIETKPLGWVFRVSDMKNYYVMKLDSMGGAVRLIRFAVIDGKDQAQTIVDLPSRISADALLKVRIEARGPKFTTYVQGQAVDFWTDSQLKTGGLGFSNERSERAKIESVQVSF